MYHVCQKEEIEMEKIKRVKKSEIIFFSKIFDSTEEIKSDDKRAETYKKILNASQLANS